MKAGCRELFSKQKSKGLDGNSKEKKKKEQTQHVDRGWSGVGNKPFQSLISVIHVIC